MFARSDAGRQFDILVNGELLQAVTLEGDAATDIYTRDLEIPVALTRTGKLLLVFRAHANSIAGGLYDLRLLR
jgi:hypothetical protein